MAKRKPLKNSIRFEVFKRDSFTCQYCGQKAPDVILEVDHIIPVKEGGTDDIMNLVTSCRECNSGKSCKLLSDETVIEKRRKQAEELQEKLEMMEMLAQWQKNMLCEAEMQINQLEQLFQSYYKNSCFTDLGKRDIKKLIKKFGYQEVYDALDTALNYYDSAEKALNKIGGICYNRTHRGEN